MLIQEGKTKYKLRESCSLNEGEKQKVQDDLCVAQEVALTLVYSDHTSPLSPPHQPQVSSLTFSSNIRAS